jgi:hypothetical protein
MWRANSPKTHPPYHADCYIHTRDGAEYEAELIHLNPRYHTRLKGCDGWKIHGFKKKYLEDNEVVEWCLPLTYSSGGAGYADLIRTFLQRGPHPKGE